MKDSLIPSTFTARSDYKSDVPVNSTSETNLNSRSTGSAPAIPSYALTEEKLEQLHLPQMGGQTNTRNNRNVFGYTLSTSGQGTNADESNLNAPEQKLLNIGNSGLPQPGKGGGYFLASLDELNNHEIDIRGTATTSSWEAKNLDREIKIHNEDGGNIAGGAGDVMHDDSLNPGVSDAWSGVGPYLGYEETKDTLETVLEANDLQNALGLDTINRSFQVYKTYFPV